MDTEIFVCARCCFKGLHLKKQPCGHIYCSNCVAASELNGQRVCALDHCMSRVVKDVESDTKSKEICSYCNTLLDLDNIHCDMHPLNCIFCNKKFIRRLMKSHVLECVSNLSRCKFSPLGCKFQGDQLEVERHEVGDTHTELMMNVLLNLKTEQSNAISNLKETIKHQQMEINSSKQKIEELEHTHELLRQTSEMSQIAKRNEELNIKMNDFEKYTAIVDDKLKTLAKQQTDQSDNVQHNKNKLTTLITANNRLVKTLAEDKNMLNFEIEEVKNLCLESDKRFDTLQDEFLRKQDELRNELQKKQDELHNELHRKQDELHNTTQRKQDKLQNTTQRKQNKWQNTTEIKDELQDNLALDKELMRNQLAPNISSTPYIWKVKNFPNLQSKAKSGDQTFVYSDPFYSNSFGYKMRLVLAPNGDGAAKGTHLSVFLELMKGPNDAILDWPIEYTFEITLLAQTKDNNHYSALIQSDSTDHKHCFDKPISEYNLGFGCPYFISLDKVGSTYLVDKTIFIKVVLINTENYQELMASDLCSFPYIWKVENFAKLRAKAKSDTQTEVYSNSFYSKGYKMRLKINPNGVGLGTGDYLSIFIQVMKGPYNAILNWPVEYSGNVSVLDQSTRKDDYTKVLTCDLINFKHCFDKPTTGHNMPFGKPTFLRLDQLVPLYLVDDTIFIKLDLTITS